jgi:hypothetical protein
MKRKRKDTCLFCNSRSCYERVLSTDGGQTYDEIACHDHIQCLYKHSDKAAPNVMKCFISSTGKHKRGEYFNPN